MTGHMADQGQIHVNLARAHSPILCSSYGACAACILGLRYIGG